MSWIYEILNHKDCTLSFDRAEEGMIEIGVRYKTDMYYFFYILVSDKLILDNKYMLTELKDLMK